MFCGVVQFVSCLLSRVHRILSDPLEVIDHSDWLQLDDCDTNTTYISMTEISVK